MYSCLPLGLADRTGVVNIFIFLELEQIFVFSKGLYLKPNNVLIPFSNLR